MAHTERVWGWLLMGGTSTRSFGCRGVSSTCWWSSVRVLVSSCVSFGGCVVWWVLRVGGWWWWNVPCGGSGFVSTLLGPQITVACCGVLVRVVGWAGEPLSCCWWGVVGRSVGGVVVGGVWWRVRLLFENCTVDASIY
jgi:hypothetical protein